MSLMKFVSAINCMLRRHETYTFSHLIDRNENRVVEVLIKCRNCKYNETTYPYGKEYPTGDESLKR
jgi:hypothetical protein